MLLVSFCWWFMSRLWIELASFAGAVLRWWAGVFSSDDGQKIWSSSCSSFASLSRSFDESFSGLMVSDDLF